jgi:diguanylate cyclase (GGDEF)-like protein
MRVLIAEDDPITRHLLGRVLQQWGDEPVHAADGEEAWRLLDDEDPPPVAIVDWMMPGLNGVELCLRLRRKRSIPYTYVILLTAKSGRTDVIEGLAAGADDYISKPFDIKEFEVRLRVARRIAQLQMKLLAAQEQLRLASMRDPATGLWHRGAMFEFLESELGRARRIASPLGVILIDVDAFKGINDAYGHLIGDMALQEALANVRSVTRESDILGRYGGDEFMLITPNCGGSELFALAERIRATVEAKPIIVQGSMLTLTLSVGVAEASPHHPIAATELLRLADVALYQSKRNGKNRVCGARA